MLMVIIFILIQAQVTGFTMVQIITYIIAIINILVLIIMTGLVKPTYNKVLKHEEYHSDVVEVINKVKILHTDYINRISPQALELSKIEKDKLEKFERDIAEIKHNLNNLTNQLGPLLKKLSDEPDMTDLLKAINKLNDKL